jgi:hypothetical protein
MDIAKSLVYFLLAGLCEIGGGYLVWLWLREGKSLWVAGVGALVLILYGTFPPCNRLILDACMRHTEGFLSSWRCSGGGSWMA